MIRNIIFDIGNVLVDFCWRDFLLNKGFDEAMVDRIAVASVKSGQWCELDRGIWSEEEVISSFVSNDPAIEKELHAAYDNMHGIIRLRDYSIKWIRELKDKGYRVWYLSNFPEKVYLECAEELEFIPYTDGGILSYRDKVIKPDPAIYELLLERFGLHAEECVFLDDSLKNVEAAVALGICGICFKTKEQAEEELHALGVC